MPSYLPVFCFFRSLHFRKTSTASFWLLLSYNLFHSLLKGVQFTTHLSNSLDKFVFKEGATFVFKYPAVTSENESKIRVFSPFPKVTEINLIDVHIFLQMRGNTNSMTDMVRVKFCRTERMGTLYDQRFNQLDEKLFSIEKEVNAAHTDQNQLVEVAACVLFATFCQARAWQSS